MNSQGPGQVLFHFVRHWASRPVAADVGGERGRLVTVCEAVYSLCQRGTSTTVNAIAHEVGIDQSGASRLIKSAKSAGYLAMAASPSDGRQREASLTPAGLSMLEQAHRWQEDVFAQLTTTWNDKRRRDFYAAMRELMDSSYTMDT